MRRLESIGRWALSGWQSAAVTTAVVWSVLWHAVRIRSWPRTVRARLTKQLLFTGVDAVRVTLLVAFLAGVSIVVQTQVWLTRFGQSEMLGPVLVAVIFRDLGPLLVNILAIGRSGTAIATELANMRVRGEIGVLEAQGVDTMVYVVMPRVLGLTVSVLCLTIVFVAMSFGTGYVCGAVLGVTPPDPYLFGSTVLGAVMPRDVAGFAAKVLIPALAAGAICCTEGLSVGGAITEVPRAATASVIRSIAALLLISAVVSVLTYVRGGYV